jgi:hypothetical protein
MGLYPRLKSAKLALADLVVPIMTPCICMQGSTGGLFVSPQVEKMAKSISRGLIVTQGCEHCDAYRFPFDDRTLLYKDT